MWNYFLKIHHNTILIKKKGKWEKNEVFHSRRCFVLLYDVHENNIKTWIQKEGLGSGEGCGSGTRTNGVWFMAEHRNMVCKDCWKYVETLVLDGKSNILIIKMWCLNHVMIVSTSSCDSKLLVDFCFHIFLSNYYRIT